MTDQSIFSSWINTCHSVLHQHVYGVMHKGGKSGALTGSMTFGYIVSLPLGHECNAQLNYPNHSNRRI